MKNELIISIVGNVITNPFSRLKAMLNVGEVEINNFDYGQIEQCLMVDEVKCDYCIVHLTEDYFFDEKDLVINNKIELLTQLIKIFLEKNKSKVVINTIIPLRKKVVGIDYFQYIKSINSINNKLIDLSEFGGVKLIDLRETISNIGSDISFNFKNKILIKFPYTKKAVDRILEGYKDVILEDLMPRKKLVLVDADNTLWGGVVGEDGASNLLIDEQYPGKIFKTFQEKLIRLKNSGVLLGLISKNNLNDVEEVFKNRDMPLKLDDFIDKRINWLPKSENIASIVANLNIGLDSVIFIDDNEFELNEVKHALPEVEVYRFSLDSSETSYEIIENLTGIKVWSITREDLLKQKLYVDEGRRKKALQTSASIEDYLESLEIAVTINLNRKSEIQRISQLTNKTNQFNLTTRRYSETDIAKFMENEQVFDIQVSDKFGDMGLVGVIIVNENKIDTFLMSCRVLGRQIESSVMSYVCKGLNNDALLAEYVPTKKNQMVLNFYESLNFTVNSEKLGHKIYKVNLDELPNNFRLRMEGCYGN